MLPEKKKKVLLAMNNYLDAVLQKIDKENEKFILPMEIEKAQKAVVLKAMDDFEKSIQAFFVAQKKDYVKQIKELPQYLQKWYSSHRKKIKKASITDDMVDSFIDIVTEFVFANDKYHIDKLMSLYEAFSTPLLSGIAEITGNSMVGSKRGSDTSLSTQATKWLDNHKIQFAKEVNKTTHDTIINCIKEYITGGNGSDSIAEGLMEVIPDFFNLNKIGQKKKVITVITDPNLYIKLYKEVEKQSCFEFYRARRIARTESIPSYNAGTLEGWRQSRVVTGKTWMCANDERSRDNHKAANNQTVAIEEPFIVGGEKLMHPGDSSLGASAKNIILCRCTMKAKLRFQEEKA